MRRLGIVLCAALAVAACGEADPDTTAVDSPEPATEEVVEAPPISPSPELDAAIAKLPVREGRIDVEGGSVWYRIVGVGSGTPLLLLHGGPGAPSYYLEMLAALGDERPVVFYDQLGAGRSDMPSDTTLWTIDRFVRELAMVRTVLKLDQVHILGHSWGSMLATDYMLTEPVGVESLIFAGPALSVSRWVADTDSLFSLMPPEIQEARRTHEAAGTTDSQEYMDVTMAFYARHLARRQPWPAQMDSVFARFGGELYGHMWGPSEFAATGTLRSYERVDRLAEIEEPILFLTGRYDEAVPSTVEWYASMAPNSEMVVMENSAHIMMLDEPEATVQVIRDWLRRVEGN